MEGVFIAVIQDSLALGNDWQVDRVLLDRQQHRIDVYISHSGGVLVCPETGERGSLYDHKRERTWRHLDWFEFQCFIHCRVPRLQSSAGVKTIETRWASASNRFTHAFERWTIELLKATKNQTRTAQLLRCGFDVINRRSLDDIAHLSVDEKAI